MYYNLSKKELLKHSSDNNEGRVLSNSRLSVLTGKWSGRCPTAKKYVLSDETADFIDWDKNEFMTQEDFDQLHQKFLDYDNASYLEELSVARSKDYRFNVDLYTEYAWHALFGKNMFFEREDVAPFQHWKIYHYPNLLDYPLVAVSFRDRCILISGTHYAGEIKKSIFSVINFEVAQANHLPMHCSANCNEKGETTLYFGLSGTGKTTLSLVNDRVLLGDDEHIWDDRGITNIEGGCYAKVINLSKDNEKLIWNAIQKEYSILENVVINEDNECDFTDSKYSQNSRCSFDIDSLDVKKTESGKHPENVVFLTYDAFGILPSVSLLNEDQAKNLFCLGYTSKVAGTELGVTEPQATYSHCFGSPFLPHKPEFYGEIFSRKIRENKTKVWLVNTGFFGGDYKKGQRIPIKLSRKIIKMINNNKLSNFFKHKYTNLNVPIISDFNNKFLMPESGWDSIESYKNQLGKVNKLIQAIN
jgi:phosphoenolpyruvate carboxykinase (ATP)